MSDKKKNLLDNLSNNLPTHLTPEPPPEDDVKDDYEFSRDMYRELARKGQTAIDDMMQLAAESEHPRAFEVLSNMLKQNAEITEKLMSLQKDKKKLEEPDKEEKSVTNNNLFVGSTTDLQKMLHGEKPIDHE